MVSSNIPSEQSEAAVIQASRQRRLEIQAARHAAFNDACFRDDGSASTEEENVHSATTNFPIFLHGALADADTLVRVLGIPPPPVEPARILDADAATVDGQSVLVRFPRPGVDGVFALLPRQTVMPLLEAYYGNKCEATFVPIKLPDSVSGRIMLAAACIWTGRPAPVTTRRLFFHGHGHGSLADPQTLGKVLRAPPGHVFDLVPAVLEGGHVRQGGLVPGADSERVEGCTYECAGRLIPLIEDYYGENYAPVEVTVAVSRADGLEERVRAWCYVWDELRDDNPAI